MEIIKQLQEEVRLLKEEKVKAEQLAKDQLILNQIAKLEERITTNNAKEPEPQKNWIEPLLTGLATAAPTIVAELRKPIRC